MFTRKHGFPGSIDADLGRQMDDALDGRQLVKNLRHLPGIGDIGLEDPFGKGRREIQPVDLEGFPQGIPDDSSDETVDAGNEQFGFGHGESRGL